MKPLKSLLPVTRHGSAIFFLEASSETVLGARVGHSQFVADEFDFDRTSCLRRLGFASRNLGKMQMTTDTAIRVTHRIIESGISFDKILFVDRPEITSDNGESLIMNFRFLSDELGNPIMVPRVREILLEQMDFDLNNLE